jgi:hypothetical protein
MTKRSLIPIRKGWTPSAIVLAASALLCSSGHSLAWLGQSPGPAPVVNPQACTYDLTSGRLTLKGENFQRGATVTLKAPAGQISISSV